MLTCGALEGVSGKMEAPQGRSHKLRHDTMEREMLFKVRAMAWVPLKVCAGLQTLLPHVCSCSSSDHSSDHSSFMTSTKQETLKIVKVMPRIF